MSESKKILALAAPLGVIAVVGLAAWLVSLSILKTPPWGIFLANFLFFTSVTQGVLALAVILRFTSAKWSAGFFRLATATAVSFFPVALGMLVVLFVLRDSIFYWAGEEVHNLWFNSLFFVLRNSILFVAVYAIARALHRYGDTGDDRAAETGEADSHADHDRNRLLGLGFAYLLLFALFQTVFAWDFGMIINRHWADSMFAPLFGITSVYGGAATIVLLMAFTRRFLKSIAFSDQHFYNMGQLILGLCVFWVYGWYIQFFSIWFANLPEEFEPIYARIFGGYGGIYVSYLILGGAVPFFLLIFKKMRESVAGITMISGSILLAVWLERYIMSVPALVHEEKAAALAIVHPVNLLYTAGVLAVFGLLLLLEIRRRDRILPTTEEALNNDILISDPMGWQ